MSVKTWVAVSADTARDYCFSLPLTALFWREVIGFQPLCMMVGPWHNDQKSSVAGRALIDLGMDMVEIKDIREYLPANVAQNVREHAAADARLAPDDWLLPSDADLWPLRKDFYIRHEQPRDIMAYCLYSNGDHFQGKEDFLGKAARLIRGQTIPTCHVVMRASTWRTVYGYAAGDDIGTVTKRTMDAWIPPRAAGKSPGDASFVAWMSDQDIVTWQLCRQEWFPARVEFVPRRGHPPTDRLCRSNPKAWVPGGFSRFTDCHAWKAPDSPEHWALLREVIREVLPGRLQWADDYRERFWRSYN